MLIWVICAVSLTWILYKVKGKLLEEIFVKEVDGYLTELSGSPIMYGENYDPKSRISQAYFLLQISHKGTLIFELYFGDPD